MRRLPSFCSVKIGTVEDIDERDLFDTVLYIDVLEHIEKDAREVLVAAQHLKRRGHLIILSPAHQGLYCPFDASIGHFRRYDKGSLSAAIPRELRRRKLVYVDAVGALASIGNRFILKSGTPTQSQIAFWDRAMIPLSRIVDPLLHYQVGKTIIGVWRPVKNKSAASFFPWEF